MKTKLLHIDTSPRIGRSQSRALGADFIAAWQANHSDGVVQTLDLTTHPVPLVTTDWVEGAFTAPAGHSPGAKEAITVSDRYVDQLLAADQVVITTPIYNLSLPAALKAWIDQIVRVGRTFLPENGGFKGAVTGKKFTVIVASGGDLRPNTPGGGYNFLEPYLRAVLGFIGVTDITFVYGHSLNLSDEIRAEVLADARRSLQHLATV